MIIVDEAKKPFEARATNLTITFYNYCPHYNGRYGSIKTLFRSIKIYSCSDCGRILQGKELKQFKDKK